MTLAILSPRSIELARLHAARSKGEDIAGVAAALTMLHACALYLAGVCGPRIAAEELYRWADRFAVIPEREEIR